MQRRTTLGGSNLPCRGQEAPQSALPVTLDGDRAIVNGTGARPANGIGAERDPSGTAARWRQVRPGMNVACGSA